MLRITCLRRYFKGNKNGNLETDLRIPTIPYEMIISPQLLSYYSTMMLSVILRKLLHLFIYYTSEIYIQNQKEIASDNASAISFISGFGIINALKSGTHIQPSNKILSYKTNPKKRNSIVAITADMTA